MTRWAQSIAKLDFAKIKGIYVAAMAQVFTADELAACADFYSAPQGRTVMSKLTKFTLALAPGITAEMEKLSTRPCRPSDSR